MKDIIDEMQLPLTNPKEELETISVNKFSPLFDIKRFEIRPEPYRDKGIDHTIELKKSSKFTNFRTIIQLKATESIDSNSDGSFSLQIYTSNIQYLLNGGIPAYYVLYVKTEDTFYYENLNSFVAHLNEKDQNWQTQKTHILRFREALNSDKTDLIYEDTYKVGLFNREIRERLAYKNATLESGDKILFDSDLNVTSDQEIKRLIEGIGLELINEGRWNDILLLHSKTSTGISTNAKYNLVLGLANYYTSNYFDSLQFFKKAILLKTDLNEELQNHLYFFDTTVRYGIGLIDLDQYNSKIKELESDDNLALYIKLDEAKKNYLSEDLTTRYEELMTDFDEILNDPRATDNIKLTVRSERILYSGYQNNMDYFRSISMINALEEEMGPNAKLRIDTANRMHGDQKAWHEDLKELKEQALSNKNHFVYYLALINEVKVLYEFEVYFEYIQIIKDLPGQPPIEKPDNKPILEKMISALDEACSFFNEIGHIDNRTVAQATKYEILHFLKRYDQAQKIINHLQDLAEINEMKDLKDRLDFLTKDGTTHERFQALIEGIFKTYEDKKKEWESMKNEMLEMDGKDKNLTENNKNESFTIHLFPIGYFIFPKSEFETALKILNTTSMAQEQFARIHELGAIPIANIHYDTIEQEGPQDGNLADRGFESWKNIYRIRKAFFDKGFQRTNINF